MKFSRLATESDFEKCVIYIDGYREMDDDVKWSIEQGDMYKAVKHLREKTGMGINSAKEYCQEYERFIMAKKDFENGKLVFVHY